MIDNWPSIADIWHVTVLETVFTKPVLTQVPCGLTEGGPSLPIFSEKKCP